MTILTHKFDIYILCKLYSYPLKRQGITIIRFLNQLLKISKSNILFNQSEGSGDNMAKVSLVSQIYIIPSSRTISFDSKQQPTRVKNEQVKCRNQVICFNDINQWPRVPNSRLPTQCNAHSTIPY